MKNLLKPHSQLERDALRNWQGGEPAKAMIDLRAGGYSEEGRRAFLRDVVGVKADALLTLELWRDSYLDWLAEQDEVASSDHAADVAAEVECPSCGDMMPADGRRECRWCSV